MNEALKKDHPTGLLSSDEHLAQNDKDWRKQMSNHVAYALLTYTALQIFVTMLAVKSSNGSILPYFALIILVAAIIPGCQMFEARWTGLSDEEAADPAFARAFRKDAFALWLCAIGLPFAFTGAFKAVTGTL